MEVVEKRVRKIESCWISSGIIRKAAQAMDRGAKETAHRLLLELGPDPEQVPSSSNLGSGTSQEAVQTRFEEKKRIQAAVSWRVQSERIGQIQRLKVEIESPTTTAQFSSLEALDRLELPAALRKITIEAGDSWTGYFHGRLNFDLDNPTLFSEYAIEGRDSHTVNGVAKTLDDLLKEGKTRHSIFYKERYTALVAILVTFLACWSLVRAVDLMLHLQTGYAALAGVTVLLGFSTVVIFWIYTEKLLQWLFPYFIYAEDKENKRRNSVRTLFYTLMAGLSLPLIYDLIIRPLFLP